MFIGIVMYANEPHAIVSCDNLTAVEQIANDKAIQIIENNEQVCEETSAQVLITNLVFAHDIYATRIYETSKLEEDDIYV